MEPFFEKGNDTEIRQAKLEWRRMYKAQWRKEHRRKCKEITASWDNDEYRMLKAEAKRHKLSITMFIKQATIGYVDKRYIPLQRQEVTKILQLLALTFNVIDELGQEEQLNYETAKELKNEITRLEQSIRVVLFSPKTIWQILTEALMETPQMKADIILFIQSFD